MSVKPDDYPIQALRFTGVQIQDKFWETTHRYGSQHNDSLRL